MNKRRRLLSIVIVAGLVIGLVVIIAAGVLHSRAFHRYVLAKIEQVASQKTGGRVRVGDFQLHLAGLRVDFYRLVLHGSEPASAPPLLRVEHLVAGVKVVSLWRRQFSLYEVLIDQPAINLTVDQARHANLPTPPPSKPGTKPTNIFDLAIGRFAVSQGVLNYNDRHVPLDGEIRDLAAEIGFDSARTEYRGTLSYRVGRIHFGNLAPVPTSLHLRFGATASTLTVNSVTLTSGKTTLSASGRVQNYSNPSASASYHATISTADVAPILNTSILPAGEVAIDGQLQYQSRADHPLIENLSTAGGFRSASLVSELPQARAEARAVAGTYRLSDGALTTKLSGHVMGGTVTAALDLTHLAARPQGHLTATASDLSLGALGAASDTQPLERAALTGSVNANAEGVWEGSIENLTLRADATISGSAPVPSATPAAPTEIPINGALHAVYDGRSGTIALRNTDLATRHLTLNLEGTAGKQSSLAIKANCSDLAELDSLATVIRRALASGHAGSSPIVPVGVAGSASFTGQLRGSATALHLMGQLASNRLQYRNTTLSLVKANIALSPSLASLDQGELRTSTGGQLHFNASVGLKHWAYTPQSPMQLNMTAANLEVAPLAQLAHLHYPIAGTLAAQVAAHGSQSELVGQGSASLTQASMWGQPIQNFTVHFQGAGKTLDANLQVVTLAGAASGRLTYDFAKRSYDAQLSVPGLQIEKLQAVDARNLPVTGIVTLSATGEGTLDDPQLTATIATPTLLVSGQKLDGLAIHAAVAHQQATFTLISAVEGAAVDGRGTVSLKADFPAQATLDVRNVALGPILAAFVPQAPPGLSGRSELHGSLHGPLRQPEQIEAQVELPVLELAYKSYNLRNDGPIRAAYHTGVVSLSQCALKGTDTDLHLQATVPLAQAQELKATANGQVNLHLLQLVDPDWDATGRLDLNLNAAGALSRPDVNGTVRLSNVALEPPNAILGVQNLNATLKVKNGRVDVQELKGEAGGGTFIAEGFASYQPAVQYNLALTLQKVRLRYPVGTRAILDGNISLTGSGGAALMNGQVMINRFSLTKEFDLTTFTDQFSQTPSASGSSSFAQNIKLNVALRSASTMALASNKLSVQGTVNLTVRGTLANPVILGRTNITGGEVFFNGNRYVVQSGVIEFVNPVETQPVVNLLVTTTINQFNLTARFVGPLDRLNTTYTSDPPLAPVDIINLIATGQTTEAASTTSTSPQSVVAGQLTSQLSNRVEKLAGISSLTIDPQVGGAGGNGVGRLAVQQRVTRNLFFTFSTDLTTSTGDIVQVEYQATKRYALSTIRDQNGGYTVEVKVHKSF